MNNIIHYRTHHEQVLRHLIQEANIPALRIKEAMLYVLFPGGKRLRPLLVYLCGHLIGAPPACLDSIAAAIELMHCYSLVHDDLPAMDNDDMRRGKPSCHRAFDEATAILVGDGLQALAIEILLRDLPKSLRMEQVVAITHELVSACGPSGMVSGQSLDLSELTHAPIQETQLQEIHLLKTGKLISACINMVLLATNPAPSVRHNLRKFALHLGLFFQIQDDYLDRYDETNTLGKGRCSDEANQKITYANLYDKQALSELIDTHLTQAQQALSLFQTKADELQSLLASLDLKRSIA